MKNGFQFPRKSSRLRHAELVSASYDQILKQVQGDAVQNPCIDTNGFLI